MAAASQQETNFATVLLRRNEVKKKKKAKHPLDPELSWLLLGVSSSPLFTPFPAPTEDKPAPRPLDKQSYQRWRSLYSNHRLSHPQRTTRRTIVLQPLAYSSPDYPMEMIEPVLLESLAQFCTAYFTGMSVVLADSPVPDLAQVQRIASRVHPRTNRQQLLVEDVVKYIIRLRRTRQFAARHTDDGKTERRREDKPYCVVGLTLVDLYPSGPWNFTLGQASFNDGVAVCSFGRHFNSQSTVEYSESSTLYKQIGNMWVLVRVISHEIGHLFGITHCYYFNCAMNESSTIEEAVKQPLFLCPVCLRKLQTVLKFNIQERYRLLREQCYQLLQMVESVVSSESQPEDHSASGHITAPFRAAIEWIEECLTTFDTCT